MVLGASRRGAPLSPPPRLLAGFELDSLGVAPGVFGTVERWRLGGGLDWLEVVLLVEVALVEAVPVEVALVEGALVLVTVVLMAAALVVGAGLAVFGIVKLTAVADLGLWYGGNGTDEMTVLVLSRQVSGRYDG